MTKTFFHTNAMAKDQPFKYILRDIPVCLTPEDIKQDLEAKGFTVNKVTRLFKKDKVQLLVVLVQLSQNQRNIHAK